MVFFLFSGWEEVRQATACFGFRETRQRLHFQLLYFTDGIRCIGRVSERIPGVRVQRGRGLYARTCDRRRIYLGERNFLLLLFIVLNLFHSPLCHFLRTLNGSLLSASPPPAKIFLVR
ncbi:hypothetical protein LY78DRAFT_480530 [Colletotrichum sublineola]|nr:hypothetical protein LY78DRAFT_480530 [Colletotrichum sublineola]